MPDADPARAVTRSEFGAALRALGVRSGLSQSEIAHRTKTTADPVSLSTLNDAFNGKTLIKKQSLERVLAVCGVSSSESAPWLDARARIETGERGRTTPRATGTSFDTVSPHDLGIHNAIETADTADDLPFYVERDFDFKLRTALTVDGMSRRFVVLVGGSSAGKTRSLYEAVRDVAPNWWLVHPSETEELLDLKDNPPSRTVFWLDELHRYLGSNPPLSFQCVRALTRNQNIVVGTLWPDQYDSRVMPRQSDAHEADDIRRLLRSAVVINVPDDFTPDELDRARTSAVSDTRIKIALESHDGGLTQVLAGGPALVERWEMAPNPYAKAIITAAADAHRLGVQSPLTEDVLTGAMFGYLRPPQRVEPHEVWLSKALPHACRQLYGDVRALSPVDDGRAGTRAGYVLADYLAQHLRRLRRVEPVPSQAWHRLVTEIGRPADLRRLADSATARLRLTYAAPALERLADEFGDGAAAIELAQLLSRQDQFESAVQVLRRRLEAEPRDSAAGRQLARTQELWHRVEGLRPAANAGEPAAQERLTEILVDDGICDELRIAAAAGDAVAAEDLVERLAGRGRVQELRERADQGHVYAAEALADLYVAWGDVELLQARAGAGDQVAELRLSKLYTAEDRSTAVETQVTELRAAAGADPDAARRLCTVLFELRQVDGLRAELEAGTHGAADRLIALYTADETMPAEELAQLRAFGLAADGEPISPSR